MAADPNRVPWGNMYEFTVAGTFVVTLMYLVLYRRFKLEWMAPIVVGFVLTTLMVAVIWLHEPVQPLREALNSYWLVIHVVSAVIATGAFTLGGIASVMYLVKMRAGDEATGWLGRVPTLEALDKLAYRVHAFAFPVWTFAVLITGPIWAHEAWSRYWNWDPKEVWAFITWVVYAGYLHARATAGWKGRNAAILALVGVATLWFNFIGINYFSTSSQHSYAIERGGRRSIVRELEPRGRIATSGVVGRVEPLAVEVAQELLVVVRRDRTRRRARPLRGLGTGQAGPLTRAALLERPGDEIGHRCEDQDDQQKLAHASRVDRPWSPGGTDCSADS